MLLRANSRKFWVAPRWSWCPISVLVWEHWLVVGYMRLYIHGFSIVYTVSVDIFGRTLNLCGVSMYSELEIEVFSLELWEHAEHILRTRDWDLSLEFWVHADTHMFNIWPNISTNTLNTTENPFIYEHTYPTTNQCSHARALTGHQDLLYFKIQCRQSEDVCIQSFIGRKQKVTNLR